MSSLVDSASLTSFDSGTKAANYLLSVFPKVLLLSVPALLSLTDSSEVFSSEDSRDDFFPALCLALFSYNFFFIFSSRSLRLFYGRSDLVRATIRPYSFSFSLTTISCKENMIRNKSVTYSVHRDLSSP